MNIKYNKNKHNERINRVKFGYIEEKNVFYYSSDLLVHHIKEC